MWVRSITHKKFTSCSGLSSNLVQKYLTKKQSFILGHLQQPSKGLQSTQKKELQSEPEPYSEPEPDQFPPYAQSEVTNLVLLKTVDLAGKIYTEQTGRFTIPSIKCKK